MASETQYRQCRLRRGTTHTTAWIEARGAQLGKTVVNTAVDSMEPVDAGGRP
ncbi:hypothetical protein PJN91_17275 [Mycobacterium kansasii]